MSRTRLLAFALALAYGSACRLVPPEEEPPTETKTLDFTVDCLGLIATSGPFDHIAKSRTWTFNNNGYREPRCTVQWNGPTTGADTAPALRGTDAAGAVDAGTPMVNLSVVWGDALYNSYDGVFTFDRNEPGRASGTYRVESLPLQVEGYPGGDSLASITGRFDWCAADRTDCPHRATIDTLDKDFAISAPVAHGEGQAVYCRILHDTATNGVQVDMQFATWNGINVAELHLDACYPLAAPLPQGNNFQLQLTGVTGPGTYTLPPARRVFPVSPYNGLTNPLLEYELAENYTWNHPGVIEETPPQFNELCARMGRQGWVTRPVGALDHCEVALQSDRFVLDCDTSVHGGLGAFGTDEFEGPFHLESDCDWVSR